MTPTLQDTGPPHDGGTATLTADGGNHRNWTWTPYAEGALVPFPHDNEIERFAWPADYGSIAHPDGLRHPDTGVLVHIGIVDELREAPHDGWRLTQSLESQTF